jgi:enoyl-CoA hydratase/carnithine racemase
LTRLEDTNERSKSPIWPDPHGSSRSNPQDHHRQSSEEELVHTRHDGGDVECHDAAGQQRRLLGGVVCAEGTDFTSGLDMPKFFGPNAEKTDITPSNIDAFALKGRCRKPIVTAVQGIVYTIGIEMMLAGDIVVAASDSRFCQMEAKRGIAPLGGAHFRFLTRAGWGDAMYHLFLCDEFDAARAHAIGLVQEVVKPGSQIDRAMELAQTIVNNAPLGIQVTKQAALKYIEAAERDAIDYIPKIKDRVFGSEDMMEGIQSFIERRPAVFRGK